MTRRTGFTFVELLATMFVLGALAALAVPRYRNYKERAYVAAMRTDLGHLRIAQEVYWAEHQQYTVDTASLDFRKTTGVEIDLSSADPYGSYLAVATHENLPGLQCATATGIDAGTDPSGAIVCGASGGGGTVTTGTP
jgi:prepilin-type N-terminal cleavage/methylation domain-containing protein